MYAVGVTVLLKAIAVALRDVEVDQHRWRVNSVQCHVGFPSVYVLSLAPNHRKSVCDLRDFWVAERGKTPDPAHQGVI